MATRLRKIVKNEFGPNNNVYGSVLREIGTISCSMGNCEQGRKFVNQSLHILKNYNKIPDIEYGLSLLAAMFIEQELQDFPGYEKYLAEIKETVKNNPSLKQLGVFAQASEVNVKIFQGDFALAEEMQKNFLNTASSALGRDTLHYMDGLGQLAGIYALQNKNEESWEAIEQAAEILISKADEVFGFTSTKDKIHFLSMANVDLYFSIGNRMSSDPVTRKRIYRRILQTKDNILRFLLSQNKLKTGKNREQVNRLFNAIESKKILLAKLEANLQPGNDISDSRNSITQEVGNLESELSRLASENSDYKLENLTVDATYDSLLNNSSLVDFIKINHNEFRNGKINPKYFAFILNSEKSNVPHLVDLGSAKEIDQVIGDFRKKINDINDEAGLKKVGKKLYNLIFKPLEAHIFPNKLIFISPDSNLYTLPFHALVTDQGDYLINKYMFNYLNNGDDLTKIRKRDRPANYKKIVLFWQPGF